MNIQRRVGFGGLFKFIVVCFLLKIISTEEGGGEIVSTSGSISNFFSEIKIGFDVNGDKTKIWEELFGQRPRVNFKFNSSNIPLTSDIFGSSESGKDNLTSKGQNREVTKNGGTTPQILKNKIPGANETTPDLKDIPKGSASKAMTKEQKKIEKNKMKELLKKMENVGKVKSLEKSFYDLDFSISTPEDYLDRISIDFGNCNGNSNITIDGQGVMTGSQELTMVVKELKIGGSVKGEFIEKGKVKLIDSSGNLTIRNLVVSVIISEFGVGRFPQISFKVTELYVADIQIKENKSNESFMARLANYLPSKVFEFGLYLKEDKFKKMITDYFEWYADYAKEKFEKMSTEKKSLMFMNGIAYDSLNSRLTIFLGRLHKNEQVTTSTVPTFTSVTILSTNLPLLIY